jgi:hypothetical protein
VDVARNVVAACGMAGVRRLVHMSALNADVNGPSRYLRSKGEAAEIVMASGLDWTIFEPSVIFGPGDSFLNLFAKLSRALPVIALASPNARFQPAYIGDVVGCFAHALADDTTTGRRYRGPKVYTLLELVRYVGETSGSPRPVMTPGPALSKLQAFVLEHLPGKLLTRDNLASMRIDNIVQGTISVFGIAPTSLESRRRTAPEAARSEFDALARGGRYVVRTVGSSRGEGLPRRRLGARRARGRPVVDRDWVVAGATPEALEKQASGPSVATSSSCIRRRTRNTRSRAPSARRRLSRVCRERVARRHARRGFEAPRPDHQRDGTLGRRNPGRSVWRRRGSRRRHSSSRPAFAEDPLRVLRVARFAARFDFVVAPETVALMRVLVDSGELASIARERVWVELSRGLSEPRPSRLLAVLRDCGALRALLPEVDALFGVPVPDPHAMDDDRHFRRLAAADQRLGSPALRRARS